MEAKNIILGVLVLGLFAGSLYALQTITGATTSSVTQSRWAQTITAGSVTTQGGNITSLNLATNELTSKWTSFSGNVTGNIILGDTTNNVYTWTYTINSSGIVCISTNSAQTFTQAGNTTDAAIDSNFSTTGAPDNAAGTFNTTCATVSFGSGTGYNMTGFLGAATQGSSNFITCAGNSSGGTVNTNYFFCTNISSSGKNYKNVNSNFEIIAPAANTSMTYYFYAGLG